MPHPGELLGGRYRLDDPIAAGGMGEVWQATDTVLERPVAVKTLLADRATDPGFQRRFRHEARALAALRHPGVVPVYDFGNTEDKDAYLVMAHVDGKALNHVLADRGRLGAAETMAIVAQAARALATAHTAGIVHRDVKPGNLIVEPDGTVVLVDFGVARSAGSATLTGAREVVGTALYIAPEQVTRQETGPAADVYALGALAYHCLAGHPPFQGANPIAIALQHIEDEPPPLPGDVPADVSALVRRAMVKDPAGRFPSAGAMAEAAEATTTTAVSDGAATSTAVLEDLAATRAAVPWLGVSPVPGSPSANIAPAQVSPAAVSPVPISPAAGVSPVPVSPAAGVDTQASPTAGVNTQDSPTPGDNPTLVSGGFGINGTAGAGAGTVGLGYPDEGEDGGSAGYRSGGSESSGGTSGGGESGSSREEGAARRQWLVPVVVLVSVVVVGAAGFGLVKATGVLDAGPEPSISTPVVPASVAPPVGKKKGGGEAQEQPERDGNGKRETSAPAQSASPEQSRPQEAPATTTPAEEESTAPATTEPASEAPESPAPDESASGTDDSTAGTNDGQQE